MTDEGFNRRVAVPALLLLLADTQCAERAE